MYQFRLQKIETNTAHGIEELVPKRINILVGPNNSGKSRFLKELRDYISGDWKDLRIINNIDYPFPESIYDIDNRYKISSKIQHDYNNNWFLKAYSNKPDQPLSMSASLESYYTRGMLAYSGDWKEYLENKLKNNEYRDFFALLGSLFFQYMGTEERLTICKTQRDHGLDSNSANFLTSHKYQQDLLEELSEKTKQLFHKDIYLDSQTLGDRLVFRIADDFKYVREHSVYNEETAQKLFSENKLDEQGDGIKSFVSTFLSLKSNNCDILLLDEPEAFLHPPLARQMGEIIGNHSDDDKQLFVATHSVEVVKGILSTNNDVNVIRVTQPVPGTNEIKIIDQSTLTTILNDPLLRVSRVLEGIFCDRVIITEAESDELIYQELIEKIFPESGVYFAHAQNKQTVPVIAELYHRIGVNYELITDFDVLRQPTELSRFLRLMPFDEHKKSLIINYADEMKEKINNSIKADGLVDPEAAKKSERDKVYHRRGIRFFDSDETYKRKVKDALNELASHHLHILETGELETILEEFDVSYCGEKSKWIEGAIKTIAGLRKEDIQETTYVFKFIQKIMTGI